MKPSYTLFFAGSLLTLFSASFIEFLPPDAGFFQWSWLLALSGIGILAMFLGISDIRNTSTDHQDL